MFIRILSSIRLVALLLVAGQSASAATQFPFPVAGSGTHEYVSSLLCYIASGLNMQAPPHKDCIQGTATVVDETPVTPELQKSLKELAAAPRAKPQDILEWWDGAQAITRAQRNQHVVIPESLNEFTQQTQFPQWSKMVVNVSMVKRLTRVIYRSPEGYAPAMSVAVTYDSQSGDLSAPVRETEIAVERWDQSGNSDFYVYDHMGLLSPTSTFPSGERPSPSTCLGCHFDRNTKTFTREGM